MRVIPQIRLIVAASLVWIPAAVWIAAVPEYSGFGVSACLALAVLAIVDALWSRRLLDGVQLSLPDVLRASHGRQVDARIEIDSDSASPKKFRIGLSLPGNALRGDRHKRVELPAKNKKHILFWPLQALRQGRWLLKHGYLETASRLGFWGMRQRRLLNTEIRIYPGLQRERRRLSGLFLNRGIGVHVQRQVGKGREFEQLRDYLPGDSMEDIHWKASARRSAPITKVYQIERTQQVYVILDASRLSGRRLPEPPAGAAQTTDAAGAASSSILERFIVATLVTALAAERQGDQFGLISFDDRIRSFIPAKSGKAHFGVCRDAIYHLQPRRVSPDFYDVFAFVGSRLRRRSLLIFLTSLDDPLLAESFSKAVEAVCRRHVILVNMLKTEGIDPLFTGQAVNDLEEVYARLSGHLIWQRIREVEKVLHRRGIRFSLMDHVNLCPELIARYLDVKRRQVL